MQRNPSIDGWRGLSVLMVIIGHLSEFRFQPWMQVQPVPALLHQHPVDFGALAASLVLRVLMPLPILGVEIFFVISGYLITSLLIREEATRGRVSVPAFYVRRVFRILPAFWTYIACVLLLAAAGLVQTAWSSAGWTAAFLCDVKVDGCSWWFAHSWTLSVEEQYYLVWPLGFVLLGARFRARGLALALAALILTSWFFQAAASFACIAAGGLYAASPRFRGAIDRVATGWAIVLALLAILIQVFLGASILHYVIDLTRPLLVPIIFFGTLNGRGPLVRLVRIKWVQAVGLVSYSLYLWQQISTAPPWVFTGHWLLDVPVLFVVPAAASYFWIEKPMIRLGHRLSARLQRGELPAPA